MKANYHSHTSRCHHAAGSQREYIEKAIEAGYGIWGFSDHTPYPYNNGYVSPIRMLPGELEDYVRETLDLKEEYKDDIEIKLGLEVEYYPRHFDDLMKLIEDYPIEYLLLGQHHTNNEYDGTYVGFETFDVTVLEQYWAQVKEAVESKRFMYVAHPDLVNFKGDTGVYEDHMRRLCKDIKKAGVPVEINLQGIWDGRNYPDRRFWKIAGEEGLDVVIGTDTHHPSKVALPESRKTAMKLVEEFDLHLKEVL